MVAVPLPERRRVSGSRRSQVAQRKVQRQKRSLELLQGALSTHRMARQAPWLANLHRVTDGALLATGVAALAMAGSPCTGKAVGAAISVSFNGHKPLNTG